MLPTCLWGIVSFYSNVTTWSGSGWSNLVCSFKMSSIAHYSKTYYINAIEDCLNKSQGSWFFPLLVLGDLKSTLIVSPQIDCDHIDRGLEPGITILSCVTWVLSLNPWSINVIALTIHFHLSYVFLHSSFLSCFCKHCCPSPIQQQSLLLAKREWEQLAKPTINWWINTNSTQITYHISFWEVFYSYHPMLKTLSWPHM